jgi:hypothetical protein
MSGRIHALQFNFTPTSPDEFASTIHGMLADPLLQTTVMTLTDPITFYLFDEAITLEQVKGAINGAMDAFERTSTRGPLVERAEAPQSFVENRVPPLFGNKCIAFFGVRPPPAVQGGDSDTMLINVLRGRDRIMVHVNVEKV